MNVNLHVFYQALSLSSIPTRFCRLYRIFLAFYHVGQDISGVALSPGRSYRLLNETNLSYYGIQIVFAHTHYI